MMKLRTPIVPGTTPDVANRGGTAIVEMAICLPLLMLIAFGAIETANAIFLKQAIAQAAYEGARTASLPTSTKADILKRCNEIITARKIKGTVVSVSPNDVSPGTAQGTQISVTVTAPANANAISPLWFFQKSNMTKQVVMTRI